MSWSEIKLLVLDFDGVLTDNKVYVDENGREMVCCSREDSLGLAMLREKGVEVLVLSTEKNPVVQSRCAKLNIGCIQGIGNKQIVLKREIEKRLLSQRNVCYVGNDVNDLGGLNEAGMPCAVNNSPAEVQQAACYVTKKRGGEGAVREVCEQILIAHP